MRQKIDLMIAVAIMVIIVIAVLVVAIEKSEETAEITVVGQIFFDGQGFFVGELDSRDFPAGGGVEILVRDSRTKNVVARATPNKQGQYLLVLSPGEYYLKAEKAPHIEAKYGGTRYLGPTWSEIKIEKDEMGPKVGPVIFFH